MREFKFRGKRTDSGEWVYGSLHYNEVECEKQSFRDGAVNNYSGIDVRPVIEVDGDSGSELLDDYPVIPKTVGQYTGLKDRKRKEIYEGDILKIVYRKGDEITREYIRQVTWDCGMFIAEISGMGVALFSYNTNVIKPELEVIGNIHENPELIHLA